MSKCKICGKEVSPNDQDKFCLDLLKEVFNSDDISFMCAKCYAKDMIKERPGNELIVVPLASHSG